MIVEAALDTSTAVDPAVIQNGAESLSMPADDAAMEAVWDKLHPQDRVERDNGKFASPDPEKRAEQAAEKSPLEGGKEGEQPAEASTVSTDVPLPANWQGKDALWAKLPADAKAEIAQVVADQHTKLSDMGRKVSALEPLSGVGAEVTKYLTAAAQRRGEAYDGPKTPAEGINYLFNIQRMMDQDAPGTLLQIMDTYGVRDKIAALLGAKPAAEGADPAADQNRQLLNEIAELKRTIASNRFDPAVIEQVVDKKAAETRHEEEVSRLLHAKPLAAEIDPEDFAHFIRKAWKALGPDAAKQAVFDHAYNAAVEASPTLRAKSQAAAQAAKDAAEKAEAAKRGNSVNVRSTAATKPSKQSEDDAMEEVWRKHHKE